MLKNLKKYHILLASKSPRRRELLSELRIPFSPISLGGIEENFPDSLPKEDVPQYLADRKADAYLNYIHDDDLLITADTVVIKDDKIFGKPNSHEEAFAMLKELSDSVHKVVSGVCILTKDRRLSFNAITEVKFAEISDETARYYIENYHPFDKAGSYGIQEWIGCVAVEWIKGSFYNVMGLPIHRLFQELKSF